MRLVACFLLALLIAGCAQPPSTSSSVAPSVPSPTAPAQADASCPPKPVDVEHAWPAPRWRPGDYWNSTVWRGDEVEGWENVTVVGIGPVGAVSPCAYLVEVRASSIYALDAAHPDGGAINAGTQSYDARTLHAVWDDPACEYAMGPCSGDVAWPYDFPLRDGKAWTYTAGGETPVQMRAGVALRSVEGSPQTLHLNVLHSEPNDVGRGEVYRYSPLVGNTVSWERTDGGDVVEHKVLDTYRYQAAEAASAP
jgi:hypothetical protein